MVIKLQIDRLGHLKAMPINYKKQKQVSKSNAYDNTCHLYIDQDIAINKFIEDYVPPNKREELKQGWEIKMRIDDWTYRHLVGGQSD